MGMKQKPFIQKYSHKKQPYLKYVICPLHCLPGTSWRHGGDLWDRDRRRNSPATVPLSPWWEESCVCPNGVQPAQREPHWIHHHWAGRPTTWPKVLAPPPPSEAVFILRSCSPPRCMSLCSRIFPPQGRSWSAVMSTVVSWQNTIPSLSVYT